MPNDEGMHGAGFVHGISSLVILSSFVIRHSPGGGDVLRALENLLVFRPRRHTDDWRPPPDDRVQDVTLPLPDGPRIHAWWCPVADWRPTQGAMLYCHGNAGNLSHRGAGVGHWRRELGLPVLIFDYPGYGKSEGRPTEAGCYAAAAAAYDWLVQTQQIPAGRLVLYGGSL